MKTKKPLTVDQLLQLFLIKERVFEISMFCKSQGWHEAGLHLCAGSDELEKIAIDLLDKKIKGEEEHVKKRQA